MTAQTLGDDSSVVVVGAGQAAQSLVETLRKQGYAGAITMLGDEPVAPYQRPPLSKRYLLGDLTLERLHFRPPAYYTELSIDTRWGARVTSIDRDRRVAHVDGGGAIAYDALALTTGSRPRLLPQGIGGRLPGVYPIRTLSDVDAVAGEFRDGRRVVIIGGGYIGLEAAAVAAQRKLRVAIVEMAPRILARVAAEETAAYFTKLHAEHGVDVRTGAGVTRLNAGEDGRVASVSQANGAELDADFVLVGVGVAPNAELAEEAGLIVENGVAVDEFSRTSDPRIFAAGDCASFLYRGRRIRLESVQNAIDQAAVAAKAMLGEQAHYAPTPWFWSDQYDVKLQIAGLSQGFDRTVRRAGRGERSQSIWYFQGEKLLAVDAMNDPRAYMIGKRWLEQSVSPSINQLADDAVDPKNIATTPNA